jgi:hypothetical protein
MAFEENSRTANKKLNKALMHILTYRRQSRGQLSGYVPKIHNVSAIQTVLNNPVALNSELQ